MSALRRAAWAGLLVLAAVAVPGRAADVQGVVEAVEQSAPVQGAREVARGLASWYGARFHGRRTASGERYDMHALTAAHPTLPFGTIVRVESLVNGRTVDVRINDRGPHIRQRIIDLSRAAAVKLGLLEAGSGTKPVVLHLVLPDGTAGAVQAEAGAAPVPDRNTSEAAADPQP